MISHPDRQHYLSNQIKKDYQLLDKIQNQLRYEDNPLREGQLEEQIKEIDQRIAKWSEELDSSEKHSREALASEREVRSNCDNFDSVSPQVSHFESKTTSSNQAIKTFVSFSSKDDDLRKKFEEICLSSLKQEGMILIWHKGMIRPGNNRRTSIEQQLSSCQLFLPLVSPSYVHYYNENIEEIYREVNIVNQRSVRIIPILLKQTPFLTKLRFGGTQPLPRNGKAVDGSGWKNQSQAYNTIAEELEREIQEILAEFSS